MMDVFARRKRNIIKADKNENFLFLKSERGIIRIGVISDNIIRVSYTEEETFSEGQGADFAKALPDTKWEIDESELYYQIRTNAIKVYIQKTDGTIRYESIEGMPIMSEALGESKSVEAFDYYRTIEDSNASIEEIKTADGVKRRINAAQRVFDRKLYHTRLDLLLDEDEVVFGLGQDPEGRWNLRNSTSYLYQANMKSPIPVLLSSKGYSILMSTKGAMLFSDEGGEPHISTDADEYLDYYFIYGNIRESVEAIRYLTGKAAILPKWAFGYLQSQERYISQQEIIETADKFKELNFPVSAIIQDWLSWPDNQWGQKSFDPLRYPNPKEMTDYLKERDIHFILSIWPNMAPGGANYEEFKAKGLMLPNSEVYNALSEEGRLLYWKQVYEGAFRYGVDGWWGDNAEPITPEWEHPRKRDASVSYCEYIEAASKIMPQNLINTFCANHARGLYEGQRGSGSDKRVFNLTRSGYLGGQKYGAIVWSGDISAKWETLKRQVTAALSFVTTGLVYWTFDVGGFFVKRGESWYWDGDYNNPVNDPDYLELYTRWYQLSTFLPIMRAHGTDLRREPWNISAPGTETYDILLEHARLRYALLPYIYSLAGNAYLKDELIIRPLAYDYPKDRKAYLVGNEFMLGPSLLICPVTSASCVNKKEMKVYLPEGNDWYDYYTEEKYAGGQEVTVKLTMDHLPVFVPAGAILPMQVENKYVMMVYSGKNGTLDIYNDAGDSYDYENSDYTISFVNYDDASKEVTVRNTENDKYAYDFTSIYIVK